MKKKKNRNITLSYPSRIPDLMYRVDTWDILWGGSSSDFRGLLHLSFVLVLFGNSSLCSFHEGGRWEMEMGAVTVSSFPQTCLTNPSKRQRGITILPLMSRLTTTSARWRRCVFFVGVLHHDRAFLRAEQADVGVLVNLKAHRPKDLLVG